MMKKVTVYFKSRSGKELYKTERHRDGTVTCFCPGFVYKRHCWHVEQVSNYKVTQIKVAK